MKNPIKNGKEVFAVLSMATVMSISMSVKVDAASESTLDSVADSAYTATMSDDKKSSGDTGVSESTVEDKAQTASLLEADEPADDPLVESVQGSTGKEKKETVLVGEDKSQAKPLAEDAGAEVEELEVREGNTPPAQGAGETSDQEAENSGTQKEDDKNLQKATDPNYGEDEEKIKDYDGSERYKQTDLQPGNPNQTQYKTDEKKVKDGFKFEFKNPSSTSPSKTEYGYQITIDKKTGQRTYTSITVTDGGKVPVPAGEKPMMGQGEKLTPESPDVTYKPNKNTGITASRKQRNMNYEASEETLKHINNKDNSSTSFGMKDNYTQDNPGVKFFGGNFALGYKVNPWPNENDKLEQLKLNGKYDKKVFVQGQEIDTGIKVDNIDDNAKERLVGQVYNPITGKVVPGASAYIKNGTIHIKMPEGALKKDKNDKTVINEDSIFNTDDYKALQNLDVKFFARPRTAEEFKKIAETPDEFGYTGTYTGSEAGTADINHKGTNVKIDKQGIDRYDHYNLIGGFKLNLDDTRYYDQKFEAGEIKDTSKVTSLGVKPNDPFEVKIVNPEDKTDENAKSADDMKEAQKNGEAIGRLIMDFIDEANKGKKDEDKWKVKVNPDDISKFTITAPDSAKAGDFVAIPIEYTYTNGSKDVHWFHFVVQESSYIKPEYDAQVNFPVNEQTSPAKVADNTKRIKPDRYSLPDTLETDGEGNKLATDDKGNKWTVKVDEKTGQVSAKPVNPKDFNGGEKLEVPVISHYVDEKKPGEDITKNAKAYFVIKEKANMTARYNAKAGKSGDQLSSDVILNTEDNYNRRPGKYTLDSPTYTDDKGNTWNVSIDEKTGQVTATVPNAEEGKSIDGALLNVPVTAHYYEEDAEGNKVEAGTKKTEVQFVAYGTNGKVEKTEEIPFETKVEKDPKLKKGEIKVITEGKKGSKKVTYTIENSKITKEDEQELEAPQERLIHVGEGVNDGTHKIEEKVEVGFETEIQFDDSLAPGETKEIQKGEAGEKKRDVNLTIEDGKVTKTEVGEFTETKAPKKRIIKVGRNTEGKVEHKEELPFKYKVEEVDTLKKGEYKIVKPGKVGTKTTTWTIKNSKVDGEPTVTEVAAEDALIQVGKGTNDGTHDIVEKKNIDYKTIFEYDENLDAGQQEVVKEGNPGEQERTNTLVIKDGQVTETKEGEFKTTKEATDRVVKVGTKPVTKVVEKPFNTEYVYDENLESGKTEEVTPGKNGKVTITTSYDKDQKKVVTSETEEAGQNRVVKIGGKTNGTEKIKEEIPFEVEVRKDPSLKKGEWKYATDENGNELRGEKGEQEKTLTIVNSKVTNTSEPTVTKKAKKAVVLVGEDTNDGTHEIKEKKELPFKTRIEYDENLEAGQREETGGTPGEQERTNTLVIKDGKVEETKEGEFKTTTKPVDKVIKIGIKPVVNTEEIPHDTEYEHDPNLQAGKVEKISDGTKGSVTITTTFNKETGKLETKVTRTEPTPAKYKYGSKTKGKVTVATDIPFEVEIIKDPEMEAGKTETVQEGELGEKETTITVENSKEVSREEKVIKDPVKKIVKVGTKCVCEIPPVDPEDSEKPVDPTNPSNPEDPKDPDKDPGKEDSKDPDKEDSKKPGNNTPSNPRDEEPGKDKSNKPSEPGKNTPNKPGENTSSEPGKKTPNKPGENPSVDPKNPPQESPEKPKLEKENELKLSETEKVKEAEKAKEADEEIETEEAKVLNQVKKEEDEEASRVGNEAGKANLAGDDKAPKTGDAGLMAETASAGLASGLLLLLGRFKRKKEDEE